MTPHVASHATCLRFAHKWCFFRGVFGSLDDSRDFPLQNTPWYLKTYKCEMNFIDKQAVSRPYETHTRKSAFYDVGEIADYTQDGFDSQLLIGHVRCIISVKES